MNKIVIIGGGAAGLMAAVSAAQNGGQVTLLERMGAVGRKIRITGKGRCNLTNVADVPTFIRNMPGNGPFLYSALDAFGKDDLVAFFAEHGLTTKVERGGRIFPDSDQAEDVIDVFQRALRGLGVCVETEQRVKRIVTADNRVVAVETEGGKRYAADAVIIATGGASYPGTGSTGDGYRLAEALGHTIMPLKPGLVPLETDEEWVKELQGLSLRNVAVTAWQGTRKLGEEFGEMLFTHYGVSGPVILSLSHAVARSLEGAAAAGEEITVHINLKPALTPETLDKRIQRDFQQFARRQVKNALNDLLPSSLIPVVIDLAFLDPEKFVHQVTKEERLRLRDLLQNLVVTIARTRPLAEAIVTQGGVSVKEIQPRTMASKLIQGLYFAGEVIDIDGYTGGYNLQAAFSTGYVAGRAAAWQQ